MKKRLCVPIAAAVIVIGFALASVAWEADFEPSTFNPGIGQAVTFAVCEPCLDSGAYRYAWDFDGDGITDLVTEDLVIEHAFDAAGFYEVRLTSTADDGRAKTRRLGILVGALPAYAVRETLRQGDGSIFVLVTVYVREAVTGGVGFTEYLPQGWMYEEVDVGGAMKAERADPKRYEVAWGAQFDEGAEPAFSYRLIPGYGGSTVVFDGMLNGYTNGERFYGPVCGELEAAP
jgi:hypothetical protein